MEQTAKSAQTNPPGLAETFRGHAPDQQGGRWIELWDANNTPWDRGQPHPGLEDLLVEKQDSIGQSWTVDPAAGKRRKRALVPGCGRGYDCLLLSAFGYDVYGLDISETGLKAAKAYEEAHKDDEVYQPRHENGRGKVTWMLADFFKDDFLEKIGGDRVFDLLYDYTFLSALPPQLRPRWSARLAELLSPTGVLICGEWPSEKDPSLGGPPWALPPDVYLNHLQRPGRELAYGEDHKAIEEKLGPVSEDGLERVLHIRPGRTHPAGMAEDGRIHDWISVWKHKSVT